MAKIMVSFPDELLERLDRDARERGTSRSALLQELAANHLDRDNDARARRIEQLLAQPGRFGGRGTEEVRRDRRSR
jgi:metal-responsive CopG/Arc/MetJ family transcriptional regulator